MKSSRNRSFTTTGIVLKTRDLGESDRFITVYTPDHGKLTMIGKGIRSIKSRRNSQIELLSRVKLQIWKSSKNYYLTECKIEERFADMKGALDSLSSATFMIEATEKLTADEQNIRDLFPLLNETLALMEFYPDKHELLREAFLLKLLNLLGNISSFRECSLCKQKLPQKAAFLDTEHSTLHCESCRQKTSTALHEVPLETLKLMHFILTHPLPAILKLKIDPSHLETMAHFGRVFLRQNLHHPLKSERFLGQF